MPPQHREQISILCSHSEGKRQRVSSNKNPRVGPGRLQNYLVTNRMGLQRYIKEWETPRIIHRRNHPLPKDIKLLHRDDHHGRRPSSKISSDCR